MAGYSLSIPAWEQTQLSSLGNQGLLSGVNPLILAGIDQAESSGNPGSPNSAGYGGYFGLSPTAKYPGGTVGSGEGQNTVAEFDKEAQIAASEFASLLQTYGGDVIHAEYAYQQGGNAPYPGDAAALATEGPSIVNQALGGALATGVPGPGGSVTTPASQTVQLKGFGAILQSLDDLMNNPSVPGSSGVAGILGTLTGATTAEKLVVQFVVRGFFAIGFIGVAYFGLKALTQGGGIGSGGAYPGSGIVKSIQEQQRIGQAQERIGLRESALSISEASGRDRSSQGQQKIFLQSKAQKQRASVQNRRAAIAEKEADTRARRNARLEAKANKKSSSMAKAAEEALKTVPAIVAE